MAINRSAQLHSGWQGTRSALLLLMLLLVLGATLVLAAYTPWVLDQPVPPYDWTISL